MTEVTTENVGISERAKAATAAAIGRIAGKLAVAAVAHCKHPAVTWVVEITPEGINLRVAQLRMHATAIDDRRFGVAVRRTVLDEQAYIDVTDVAVEAAYRDLVKTYEAYVEQL